jgi:hypothetical protein
MDVIASAPENAEAVRLGSRPPKKPKKNMDYVPLQHEVAAAHAHPTPPPDP